MQLFWWLANFSTLAHDFPALSLLERYACYITLMVVRLMLRSGLIIGIGQLLGICLSSLHFHMIAVRIRGINQNGDRTTFYVLFQGRARLGFALKCIGSVVLGIGPP